MLSLTKYFEHLYLVDPLAVNLDAKIVTIPGPDLPISLKTPITDVREAISKFKTGKLSVELLKAGGEPLAWGLHAVLVAISQSSAIL